MRRRPVLGIMLTLTFLLLAGCSAGGKRVGISIDVESYGSPAVLYSEADLVVEIDGLPSEVERIVRFPVAPLEMQGTELHRDKILELPVFEVRVRHVLKGNANPGDTLLVIAAVHPQAVTAESGQTWLLRNSPDSTLYLRQMADEYTEKDGVVWATMSHDEGIEPAED